MTDLRWSSMQMPEHPDGSQDGRYTLSQEWCGYAVPHWVARFCGTSLGSDADETRAYLLITNHARDRRESGVLAGFRARFTDGEWTFFRSGRCVQIVEYGMGRGPVMCTVPRRGFRIFCDEHHAEAMANYHVRMDSLTVPVDLRHLDFEEVS